MTRKECETKLLSLAEQMRAVYLEYNPSGDFLTAIIDADGYIVVDDCYFNADRKIICDVYGDAFRTVDITKYTDGRVKHGGMAKEGAA